MARFRQLVNENYDFLNEYESLSQDEFSLPQRQMIFPLRASAPVSNHQPRFPVPKFHYPEASTAPRFIPPPQCHFFQPMFFEQYGSLERQRPSAVNEDIEDTASQCSESSDNFPSEKSKSKWTASETDALVYAWRECFVDLESHRNPLAWKKILEAVNKKGKKTLDQAKKKLRNLKDRYKEAKERSKRSGEARNLPNYFDVFDEVLGTRSLVQLGEVRETNFVSQADDQGSRISNDNDAEPVKTGSEASETPQDAGQDKVAQDAGPPQPKRTKKKKASKTAATSELIEYLGDMQKQQEQTMKQFLEGLQKIEESSRKHTADTLLSIANIFANRGRGKKRRRQEDNDSSLSEDND